MATAPRRRYAPRLPPAERREQLLDVALRLIVEHGYGGVTMEAVARGAGVTKPVVYDLFPNRGELLRALLGREEDRALAQLAVTIPAQEPDVDPDQVLVDAARAFIEAVTANPDPWRLILLPADGTPDVVRRHVERGRAAVLAQLEALVAWGVERRGGPRGIDTELAAQALVALGEHVGRLVLTDPERYSPERLEAFVGRVIGAIERER